MKHIEVIVSPAGATQVQTRGFTGGACKLASEFLEKALGQRVGEQLTPEFYQSVQAEQQIRQDGT